MQTGKERRRRKLKEKDLEKNAKKMAQGIKKELGISELTDSLKEIKDQMAGMVDAQKEAEKKSIMKVFVGEDVEKSINKLTKKEKSTAFAHALMTADEQTLKALSEGTPADGGYTVPEDFYNQLIKEIADKSIMRGEVTIVPMKTNVLTMSMVARDSIDVYWTTEGQVKTTTSLEFSEPTITAYKLAAIIYLTDELIDDSAFDLTKVIVGLFADRLAEYEDRAIINGSGVGQPTGLFIAGTIATRACTGNLDFDDLIDLIHDLPQKYLPRAKLLVNRTNVRELRKLKDNDGQYLWQAPVAAGQPYTVHGYPVIVHDWVPEDEILFGDIKTTYWMGERQRMTVKITNDTETTFTEDKTAVRVVRRFGGTVIIPNASRILNTIP